MPTIKPSAELRNNYNQISQFCNTYEEPIFITKNGVGDLAVMSIELYEKLTAKLELYSLLAEGLQAEREGRVQPFDEAMKDIRRELQLDV